MINSRQMRIGAISIICISITLVSYYIVKNQQKGTAERSSIVGVLAQLKSQIYDIKKNVAYEPNKQSTFTGTLTTGKCKVLDMKIVDKRDFQCVPMHTGKGDTPICVYDPKIDIYISNQLVKHGKRWEEDMVVLLEKLFGKYPDYQLLDLGSNIGIYALTALKYGRKVVAVDPNFENLKRVRASVQDGKFPLQSIILVQNAISDKYERIQLIPNKINVGGRGIMPAKSDREAADAIYMDDLLEVVKFTKAIMKIDIETAEARAMSHAEKMFDTIDIPIVFMEWNFAKTEPGGTAVRKFFETRGYFAYNIPINGKILTGDHQKWPWDIFWIRTNSTKFQSVKV